METGGMFLEERLHPSHLQDAFIIIPDSVIPDTGAALLHRLANKIHIDDVIPDIRHQLDQDDLVDTGEHLRIHQIRHLQFHKTLRQFQL